MSQVQWLKEKVFPLWIKNGIVPTSGAFIESISFEGEPLFSPQRALVQSRQIYSFCEAYRMDILSLDVVSSIVENAVGNLIKNYSLPSGAYIHAVNTAGDPQNTDLDLYTQAFVLFGLAQAYDILRHEKIKHEALKILKYLNSERRSLNGGYTEIKNGQIFYQSNPHMHLFEAAIIWIKIDSDPIWRHLANELSDLCLANFIDAKTGFLAEHFDSDWKPLLENNHFIFEPGHHYEWAWLFKQFTLVTGTELNPQAHRLFLLAEKFGLSADKSLVLDEVLSDGSIKKNSSRFWPQCERVKAAAVLNQSDIAEISMNSLFKNFLLSDVGLWRDTLLEPGKYGNHPAKASSLYHIINAISEYAELNSAK